MRKYATIVDVAKEAGVSLSTASRVLNNRNHVRPDKRERVLRAMKRLGYTANEHARSLRGGRSHTVGLVLRDIGTGYAGEIVRGIDLELADHQYDLILYTTHRRKTKESVYVASIARGLADGLLLLLPQNPDAYSESLRERSFPFVVIDHQGADNAGPLVLSTNRLGAYEATRYLLSLGHRRVGFITGTMSMISARERLAGYREALREFKVAEDGDLVRTGDFMQPRGFAAANELLDLPDRPTAIFASNDVSAFGVLDAVRAHGLRVPEDISVVGFDDVPQAAHVNPPLTTVRQPLEQMGRAAAHMLLEIIRDPEYQPQRIELATELIVRGTTQKPRDRIS